MRSAGRNWRVFAALHQKWGVDRSLVPSFCRIGSRRMVGLDAVSSAIVFAGDCCKSDGSKSGSAPASDPATGTPGRSAAAEAGRAEQSKQRPSADGDGTEEPPAGCYGADTLADRSETNRRGVAYCATEGRVAEQVRSKASSERGHCIAVREAGA